MRLGQMFPGQAKKHAPHADATYAVLSGEGGMNNLWDKWAGVILLIVIGLLILGEAIAMTVRP